MSTPAAAGLVLPAEVHVALLAHLLDQAPLEGCGLLSAPVADVGPTRVAAYHPCANEAASAVRYTVAPRDHLRADRAAEDAGHELVGVVHSHTHTEAWPSPTDIEAAFDPGWHYVIVSLRQAEPVLRSFRIADGVVTEEPVVVTG